MAKGLDSDATDAQMRRCVEGEMHKVRLALAAGAETGETPALPKRPLG
jgi:hypothetical protein